MVCVEVDEGMPCPSRTKDACDVGERDMGGSTEELSVRLDVVDVICPEYDVDRGSRALRRSSEVIPSLLKHSN